MLAERARSDMQRRDGPTALRARASRTSSSVTRISYVRIGCEIRFTRYTSRGFLRTRAVKGSQAIPLYVRMRRSGWSAHSGGSTWLPLLDRGNTCIPARGNRDCHRGNSEADQDADGTRGGASDFRPRCKKIEMLPAPLFAVTSPGSSVSFVLRVRVATANGPPFVR